LYGGFFAPLTSYLRGRDFIHLVSDKKGRKVRSLSMPTLVGIAMLCSSDVLAQELNTAVQPSRYEFEIKGVDASVSLKLMSEITGKSLIFSQQIVEGIQTKPLSGEYSVEGALKTLLEGTGLTATVTSYGVILVKKAEVIDRTEESTVNVINKVRPVSGAAAAFAAVSTPAFAQTANARNDEIIVTGIKKSLKDARNQKRNSSGVVDAIAAKEIGQLPDTNLAESLQRITGVSIDRSGGEGQFITVRGFGPEFNTVLVNGRQIASEDLSRAFAFDTIASELVSNIQVNKTSTAVLQSGGIGSTVNIATARPLDNAGFRLSGSAGGTYDSNTNDVTPNFSGVVSNTTDDGHLGF